MENTTLNPVWFEQSFLLKIIYLVSSSTNGFKPISLREDYKINATAATDLPRTLIEQGILVKKQNLLFCTLQGEKIGELLKKIGKDVQDPMFDLLERNYMQEFLMMLKNSKTPLIQNDFRKVLSQSVVIKNIELGLKTGILQEVQENNNSAYILSELGTKSLILFSSLWSQLSNACMKTPTQEITQFELDLQKGCYFCKRTKSDFQDDVPFSNFKKSIESQIALKTIKLQQLIKRQLDYLNTLERECSQYQKNLTIWDIKRLGDTAKKIVPNWEKLQEFVPDNKMNFEKITIGTMFQYLQEKIKFYQENCEGDYALFVSISQRTDSRYSRSSTEYQQNEDAIQNEARKIPPKEIFTNISNPELSWGYSSINYYFDPSWNELKKYDHYDGTPDEYSTKDNKTFPNNQTILIALKVLLCPVCSAMFNNASDAASKIYEYKKNQMDDYD